MTGGTALESRAERLRREFDAAFAAPRVTAAPAVEDVLTIRVGGEPWAVRLAEIAGIVADATVTPLPTAVPGQLGVAALRGTVVAVHDLRLALGRPAGQTPGRPAGQTPGPPAGQTPGPAAGRASRWLVLTAADPLIALAFDDLEGHGRVPAGAVVPGPPDALVREVVRTGGGTRPLVPVARILESVRARVRRPSPRKEP